MTTIIVFIDSRVANYQTLITGLVEGAKWHLLYADQDGLAQMAAILANYGKLDAVHLISHGSEGMLYLGNTVLNSDTLISHAEVLAKVGAALTDHGDLLLYGCDVGAGETGLAFIAALAEMSGADVAASEDATGLNGDWILETTRGTIEATGLAFASYASTLTAGDPSEGNDTLRGISGADTINGLGGDDSIDGLAGSDFLYGDAGNDTLQDSQGSNYLDGGEGNDTLRARSLVDSHTLVGGLGDDTLDGVGLSLDLQGGDGVDRITASGELFIDGQWRYVQHGEATISGGAGDDKGLYYYYAVGGYWRGWDGLAVSFLANALVQGGDGDDQLSVEYTKTARLEGGAGADFLNAYADGFPLPDIGESFGINYALDGGADNDILQVRSNASRSYGEINLSLEGGAGNDTLTVSTYDPEDSSIGISQAVLSGGDGDDRLEALDVLRLTLTGGAGRDTFVLLAGQYSAQQKGTMDFAGQYTDANGFSDWTSVTARPMEITDFAAGAGGDVLDIEDLLRNGTSGFDGNNPFGNGYLRLVQSATMPADTLLEFDVNGGGDGFVTLAVLKNVTAANLVGANFNPAYPTNGDATPGIVTNGTANDDTLLGSLGSDIISGLDGNDSIDGGAGNDSILGGAGHDMIDGNFGGDTIYGGLGSDTLIDSQGANYLDGGEDHDTLIAQSLTGSHTLVGGLGDDTLDGMGLWLNLQGGDGVDQITANGSLNINGVMSYVQHGAATISGGAGDDKGSFYSTGGLEASDLANALVQGDDGDDWISVTYSKNATLEGGAGADFLYAYAFGGGLYQIGESLGVTYELDGGADDDILEVRSWANRLHGEIHLSLEGGTGNDLLKVSTDQPASADVGISQALLSGGDGDDRLEALGVLQLTLEGGAGADTFVLMAQQYQAQQNGTMDFAGQYTDANGFSAWTSITARPMEITDFAAGDGGDVLDIEDLLRNGTSGFDGNNPFGNGYLRLVQSADTLLEFDVNGDGNGFVTLAVLKNVKAADLVGANFNPAYPTNGDAMPGIVTNGTANDDTLLGSLGSDIISGLDGNDSIDGGAGNDSILGGAGNDTIDGGLGNDTLIGGQGSNYLAGGALNDTAVFSGGLNDITSIGMSADQRVVILEGPNGIDYLLDIETLAFDNSVSLSVANLAASVTLRELFSVATSGQNHYVLPKVYSGPVTSIALELLGNAGADIIGGSSQNDFINLLGGDDAVNGGGGDDVLDGGTGSNFMEGGTGRDVFFVDGRGGQNTWSTITDWEDAEQLSVWGWQDGVSQSSWASSAGAPGYQGVTWHGDLNGDGTIDTSITWSGLEQTNLPEPQVFAQQNLLWFVTP